MARYAGMVVRSDLEGGIIQLQQEGGGIYELQAGAGFAGSFGDWVGKSVVVEGDVDKGVLSFAMTGPTLTVKAIKPGG